MIGKQVFKTQVYFKNDLQKIKKILDHLKFARYKIFDLEQTRFGCVYSVEVTPVPIPNTEVKFYSGDGTAVLIVGE